MRCSACHLDTDHSRALRKAWGCDADSPNELDRVPCHCDGTPLCARCNGLGWTSLRRCPHTVCGVKERSMIRYAALAKTGVWPSAGGALDQTQSFLDGYAIVVGEIASIEEERMNNSN